MTEATKTNEGSAERAPPTRPVLVTGVLRDADELRCGSFRVRRRANDLEVVICARVVVRFPGGAADGRFEAQATALGYPEVIRGEPKDATPPPLVSVGQGTSKKEWTPSA